MFAYNPLQIKNGLTESYDDFIIKTEPEPLQPKAKQYEVDISPVSTPLVDSPKYDPSKLTNARSLLDDMNKPDEVIKKLESFLEEINSRDNIASPKPAPP